MKTSLWWPALVVCALVLGACNCGGKPPVGHGDAGVDGGVAQDAGGTDGGATDAGTDGGTDGGCGADTCGACIAGTPADVCTNGAWNCVCVLDDGGVVPNDGGTDGGQDGGFCGAPGDTCLQPSDCCTGFCAGICLGEGPNDAGACLPNLSSCISPTDCCSATCENNRCVSPQDAGTVVDAGLSPTSLCADVASKECDFVSRCRATTAEQRELGVTTNQAARTNDNLAPSELAHCDTKLGTRPTCIVSAAGWDAGRATLDQAAYLACIDASFPKDTCARDENAILALCRDTAYLVPNVTPGNLCTSDRECKAGFCSVTNGLACGTCSGYLPVGDTSKPCARDAQCDPATSYCPGTDANPSGAPCTAYTAQAGSCYQSIVEVLEDEECGPNQVCTGTIAGGFTCQAPKLEGDACTKGQDQCYRSGHLSRELTCATVGGKDLCVKSNAPVNGTCNTGEVLLGTIQTGPFCPETQYCDGATKLCRDRVPASSSCSTTAVNPCALGTHCVAGSGSTTGTCVAYVGLSGTCQANGDCQVGLRCSGNACVPAMAGLTEACSTNVVCAEGYCDTGTNTCTALKAPGDSCQANTDCASYSCGGGKKCATACWQ